jgi:hypothetical protein
MVKCCNLSIVFTISVQCKGAWGQENMFRNETHFTSGGGGGGGGGWMQVIFGPNN